MTVRPHSDSYGSNRNHGNRAERAGRSTSLLPTARACVNAINRVRRNGYAKAARVQDVAEPAFEVVVTVAAHRLRTSQLATLRRRSLSAAVA